MYTPRRQHLFYTGFLALAVALAFLFPANSARAQQRCTNGIRVEGVVTDPAGALISGATIQAANGAKAVADAAGRFVLSCVPSNITTMVVQADGFTPKTVTIGKGSGGAVHLNVQLAIAQVTSSVEVNADAASIDSGGGADSVSLSRLEVQRMPYDPDDFLRQLQVLASAAGGDPSSATITVDGFQNGGALPPKASIAAIRVNPDLFSSEYQWAPFHGGVVEIVTKPGVGSLHGSLFFTDSNGIFSSTDPFSVTATPAGKRRYGFDLTGPIVANKSGFTLALEKRDIDEFNVVNAVTLNAANQPSPFQQTVAAPQRLWIASARGDWQVTPKDMASLSFSANVNNIGNQGVGGFVLPEAGYSSLVSEYDLRFNNSFAPSANTLHETRIGYSWKRTAETPLSAAPSLLVAGYFTGGGATSQNLDNREGDLEADDNLMLTRGRHTVKLGVQSLGYFVRDYDPDTFNGAYVFGGGSAPVLDAQNHPTSQSTTITGLEQYRRALLDLAGGAPTTYQLTTGTPLVPLTQWRLGLFTQDTIKLLPHLTLDAGLRYQLRFNPDSFIGVEPRAGIAWSPDRAHKWLIHLRVGVFHGPDIDERLPIDVARLNGTRQREQIVYSPSFKAPLTPTAQSIAVTTMKQFASTFTQGATCVSYFNVERSFRQQWIARINLFWGEDWNSVRIVNINAPEVASSIGIAPDPTAALLAPRPIAPNENILEYQNSGHLAGNVMSFNLEQHTLKRLGLSFRYGRQNFKANVADGGGVNSPQSSYTSRGEAGRVEWSKNNEFSLEGNLVLPWKIDLATQFDAGDGRRYDVTTGTDNNGDGNFNDRPSYATAPGPGVYSTPFGLLTTNTVNGDVPRNIGTMPGPIHLDMNLSRAFQLNPKSTDNMRTLTLNVRSANLLNHTNATAVSSVVSSPTFSQPIAAEAARRVELGARFSF